MIDPSDSSGQSWHGRSLASTGFDGDSGQTDPALIAALAGSDDRALMAAVAEARLLVAVVAAAVAVDDSGALAIDKQTDLALVTLVAPGGERALPAFTSVAAMASWDPAARPVPVSASHVAQAAVAERCDVIVLDLGSDHAHALRPSMVWALAQQRAWLPAHEDPFVARSVASAVGSEPDVAGHDLGEGAPRGQGILDVGLRLRPGLSANEVTVLAQRVGERLATDGELRARLDGVSFRIR